MEKDRSDKFLSEKSLSDIQAIFDAGKIPGDYATWSKKNKKFVPFEWKISVNGTEINNTMAPACFYCHSKAALGNGIQSAAKGTLMFRMAVLGKLTGGKHYFAAADTLGGLLGTVGDNNTINYYGSLFDSNGDFKGENIVGKSDKACAHCHGVFQFDDFDNDTKITPLDFVKAAKDPMYMHPDAMKEAMVWQFSDNFTDENGVPKNIDIHKKLLVEEGKTTADKVCVYCHSSVSHEYQGEGYAPSSEYWFASHNFAKGSCGPAFGVMWDQLAGSLTCVKCHKNPADFHSKRFGPAAKVHMDKVACTTCHIGKKYFYRVKLIDWTLPMVAFNGQPVDPDNATDIASKIAGLDKHGYLYGDPVNGKYEDIAWLPERDFETGKVTWKLKPVNAMGVLLFEDNSSGEYKPVLARYLAKVFKVDPNLPTKYLKVKLDNGTLARVDGAIDPDTGQPIKILDIKPGVGKISEDQDLASGNYTLWRATPNYIDVNLNGQYDNGTDIQITDDTGLAGTTDGDPEINTKEEVEAAINTLKKVIASATGKTDVDVKLVATSDAFGMSHNIRPASEALDCTDCHAVKSSDVLNGPLVENRTPLYFPYDPEVENAAYFDKKIDRMPTELEFAEHTKEELIAAGYPAGEEESANPQLPSDVNVISVNGTSAEIEVSMGETEEVKVKVSIEGATINKVLDMADLSTVIEKIPVAEDEKLVTAVEVSADSKFTVKFDVTGLDLSRLTVKTDKGSVVSKEVSGNTLSVTVDPTRADDTVTVALVETPSETSSTGGGGGGCSLSTAPGFGGAISSLLGLLPLALLRRRRKNQ